MSLVIASHNLMDGRRLGGLLLDHRAVRRETGLDVLCIQENRRTDGSACAPLICKELGDSFGFVADHPRTRLAIAYDESKLELTAHEVHCLPQLARLSRFERMYTGPKPAQKYVQIATFRSTAGSPFTVANFHLDTAGGNTHRGDQVAEIAAKLSRSGKSDRFVACGDTNAFSIRRVAQLATLAAILEPLAVYSAFDPGDQPTHFFARQREPRMTHRLAVALGRLGIDVPGRYDVVCSNLEVTRRGQRSTPDSDHDLVWAEVAF